MKRSFTPIRIAACCAAMLLAAAVAPGALIVEEQFNIGTGAGEYTAGDLTNQPTTIDPAKGWSGTWATSNADAASGGLEYTPYSIGGTGGSNGHVSTAGTSSDRAIASDTTLGTASELWMRILWQPNSTLGPEFFNFRRGSSSDGRIVIRRNDTLGSAGQRNDLLVDGIAAGVGDQASDEFATLSGGDTHLLLFKLTIDRTASMDDTVDLWVDPTATAEAGLSTATASVTANFLEGAGQISQFDFTGVNTYLLDEIAIGETFADVTNTAVIPTPAALPGGVALLGMALLRRRRRS